jgi:catechol 2,3-dioxygenase-like lactoylglutathione lyase family enzyme
MTADLSRAPLLHTSVAVDDLPTAAAFFREAFGYSTAFEAQGLSQQIARMTGETSLVCDLMQLSRPNEGVVLELVAFRPSPLSGRALRVPPAHLAFEVEDLDEALERVRALAPLYWARWSSSPKDERPISRSRRRDDRTRGTVSRGATVRPLHNDPASPATVVCSRCEPSTKPALMPAEGRDSRRAAHRHQSGSHRCRHDREPSPR